MPKVPECSTAFTVLQYRGEIVYNYYCPLFTYCRYVFLKIASQAYLVFSLKAFSIYYQIVT